MLYDSLQRLSELDPETFRWTKIRNGYGGIGGTDGKEFLDAFALDQDHIRWLRLSQDKPQELEHKGEDSVIVSILEYVAHKTLRCLTWSDADPEHTNQTYHAQIWKAGTSPKDLERHGVSLAHALATALIAYLESKPATS